MKYFFTWKEAFKSDASLVGGKGWNLGRLDRYGFSVPQGVVLIAKAYDEYIKYNQFDKVISNLSSIIHLNNLDEGNVKDGLDQLRKKIMNGSMPPAIVEELSGLLNSSGKLKKSWAVRSSAVAEDSVKASFAGIHDSFLNVCGLEEILSAVKECYASLWSPRAVAYRRNMNINDDAATMAVVVMEMVEAQAAGVGFTCDVQTGRQDVMIINANFGLGESVVNGAVEPDTYYLEAETLNSEAKLIQRKIGSRQGMTVLNKEGGTKLIPIDSAVSQVLSDQNVKKLGRLLQRVFDALGNSEQHQDVEWVYNGRDFVLVQARPVTILPRKTFPALQEQNDVWSNGNYRDSVPMVQSPLNRRLMKNIIDIIHHTSFTSLGYKLPVGIQFSKFYNGRLYCNLSAYQWGLYASMGGRPEGFNDFWGGHQPAINIGDQKPEPGFEDRAKKFSELVNEARKNAPKIWDEVSTSIQKITGSRLETWKDQDFIAGYDELGQIAGMLAKEFNFLAAVGSMPVFMLIQSLNKYFEGRELMMLNALMIGGTDGITSAEHGYRLVELAEIARKDVDAAKYLSEISFDALGWRELPDNSPFKKAFCEFVKEYGHRAVYELDIINPRWNEEQTYLLGIIQSTVNIADISKLRKEQKEKREQVWKEIKDKVLDSEQIAIRNLVKECQIGAGVREETKSVLAEVMEAYRIIAKKLGFRFYERNLIKEEEDIFFCTWSEIFSVLNGEWNGIGLQALIDMRKKWKKEMELLAPPDVILGETPRFEKQVSCISSNYLEGVPVAAGKASGLARLIKHPDEGVRLQPEEIMVVPSTDPGWTPLFLKARAVVMETGGFLSHGAIVAREYGIPAVVNVPGVMDIIKDGWTISVDGNNGKIFFDDKDIKI
ncbi:pyruvate,water dikinase [Clostridium saccharoperbutylacetonicum]|uniref:Phosphoenolpyruvate synthase PpsA n=2 Tax=Clostridium TaxID=1485 RepID=M1MM76_9CLOT|nr:PEP/pyruvate-binding domain-containing protein [Clostridium saccharoperbutylacetonicum]AGF55861.1 phosphoenolpyruvate synthase PpsA [Clostridium saccharoperbutylacetonicum N1-4(HMT)]NRT63403.1 pyruvate,water dikinase [Clostridium saccharoperbutylacetonicum]NSB26765.1 pyruvate,water dikinase [Clostridium saccharoperbutylacetonicum]NSB40244.1 pyruvate,water dikinase [Clostridium saccharoperbutylacetonicum]